MFAKFGFINYCSSGEEVFALLKGERHSVTKQLLLHLPPSTRTTPRRKSLRLYLEEEYFSTTQNMAITLPTILVCVIQRKHLWANRGERGGGEGIGWVF